MQEECDCAECVFDRKYPRFFASIECHNIRCDASRATIKADDPAFLKLLDALKSELLSDKPLIIHSDANGNMILDNNQYRRRRIVLPKRKKRSKSIVSDRLIWKMVDALR